MGKQSVMIMIMLIVFPLLFCGGVMKPLKGSRKDAKTQRRKVNALMAYSL